MKSVQEGQRDGCYYLSIPHEHVVSRDSDIVQFEVAIVKVMVGKCGTNVTDLDAWRRGGGRERGREGGREGRRGGGREDEVRRQRV